MVNPLTTTTEVGVAIRYLGTIAGSIIMILGTLNWLTPEQVTELSASVPEFFAAIGAMIALGVPIYAVITKSNSDKASEVANEVDANVPADSPVVIKTPEGSPDIVVTPKV